MRAVVKALPEYDYEYYGDTKNLPYGDKTEEEIYQHCVSETGTLCFAGYPDRRIVFGASYRF